MISHTDPRQQPPNPRQWLARFPAPRRSTISNWFHYAVRAGAATPAQVLQAVRATCQRRLTWGDNTDAVQVLHAFDADQAGALAYAASVIVYEALPAEQRQRAKAERVFAFLKERMAGQEATAPQLAYLRRLRYRGALPADRAAASQLIDELRTKGGRA